ncbi:hypothetical protein GHK92_01465 [Nocardioides sp. dk4132]|uniref:hypothetical protein n=1 Tax=unclassified Nocardioides TaxID=2615069 RepID=UPI0012962B82|nr:MULTISPECIES: hypothetical protein [unclassified Nocardioides]MQW74535.1 hypothetical protein [Nocardioides sp. dk4132]QGA06459.1 hypothetical protein GFH29_02910 [Nocardioides sp. dk884]
MNAPDARAQQAPVTDPDSAPAPPVSVGLPGAVLLFAGLWMVTDPGGPLVIGWACFTVGLALLLVGVIAAGVAWGLRLDAHRRG